MTTPIQIYLEDAPNSEQMQWMHSKWDELSVLSNIPKERSNAMRDSIFERYSQNGRNYHNLNHILSFLKNEQAFLQEIQDPLIFGWSIWFHDLVYNPVRKDNEKRSADLAVKILNPFLDAKTLHAIHQQIMSTFGHHNITKRLDTNLFLDIDLAVLGASKEHYKAYSKKIRQEYWMVPLFMYRRGRKKILQHFLERKQIYFTANFINHYEEKARENLLWEVEYLE